MSSSGFKDDSSLPVATAISPTAGASIRDQVGGSTSGSSSGGSSGGADLLLLPAAWFVSTKALAAANRAASASSSASTPLASAVGAIPLPFASPSYEVIDDWTPLWRCDSDALEARYQMAAAGSGDDAAAIKENILIRNRFAEASIARREVRDAYDPEGRPAQALRRGTWFYLYDATVPAQLQRSGGGGSSSSGGGGASATPAAAPGYLPFAEEDAANIEIWAQSLRYIDVSKEQSNEYALGEVMGPGNGYFVIVARAKRSDSTASSSSLSPSAAVPVAISVVSPTSSSSLGAYAPVGAATTATTTIATASLVGETEFNPFAHFTIALEKRNQLIGKLVMASYPVRRGFDLAEHPDEKLSLSVPSHLVFVVHGIGEALWSSDKSPAPSIQVCAARMKALALEAIYASNNTSSSSSNSKSSGGGGEDESNDEGSTATIPRYVEFVAIEWFDSVHGDELDVTAQTKRITPPTVPLIRDVGNMVAMDVLLYQTPEFQYRITTTVVARLNRFYRRYCELNPTFDGSCSIVSHSLGSVITFDILSSQLTQQQPGGSIIGNTNGATAIATTTNPAEYLVASQGQVQVQGVVASDAYLAALQLDFRPAAFFAIGSPIGIFYTIRSKGRRLHNDFRFPTCAHMYNIFHPHDPVAYRIEPLFDTAVVKEPYLIEHHAGMRLQYQLKKMKVDFQQGIDAMINAANPATWMNKLSAIAAESATAAQNSIAAATSSSSSNGGATGSGGSGSSLLSSWISLASASFGGNGNGSAGSSSNNSTSSNSTSAGASASAASPTSTSATSPTATNSNTSTNTTSSSTTTGTEGSGSSTGWSSMDPDLRGVCLNSERRVDFVLQESPMEHTNSYMSALFSHSSYFENKDLVLFILGKLNA